MVADQEIQYGGEDTYHCEGRLRGLLLGGMVPTTACHLSIRGFSKLPKLAIMFTTSKQNACKTGTLGSLCSNALLIKTKSPKSKNQVVHEQKCQDLLSSTCPLSSERRVLDLESEVY